MGIACVENEYEYEDIMLAVSVFGKLSASDEE